MVEASQKNVKIFDPTSTDHKVFVEGVRQRRKPTEYSVSYFSLIEP